MIFTPPSVTNCHIFLNPLPFLERDVLYERPIICHFIPSTEYSRRSQLEHKSTKLGYYY